MFKYARLLFFILLIKTVTEALSFSAEVHVSLSGSDNNDGSMAAPFASMDRARVAALEIRARAPQEQIVLWIHKGTYRFNKTFLFNKSLSGTSTAPLVVSAWPGDCVTLSGSMALPSEGFIKIEDQDIIHRIIDTSARNNILQFDLKKFGIVDYGTLSRHGFGVYHQMAKTPPVQLYINGRRLTLSRWPNLDDKLPELLPSFSKLRTGVVARSQVINPGPKSGDSDFELRGGTFAVNFDRLKYWTQADEIWLDGIFAESWEWSYNRVAKLDPAARQISLAYGEIAGLPEKPKWTGDFFHAENLLEELDRPGEWYLDRKTGVLFVYPPVDWLAKSTAVELATLDGPIFRLQEASHIVFRDLVFENGRDIALSAQGGEGVRLENCEVRNFSNGGVRLQGKQHGVAASHLHDIGGNALVLNCGDKATLERGECFVDDNHIHDWGWYHKVFTGAVSIDGVGQRVSHNHIHHAPHGAIYLRGNDHLVESNNFHHLVENFTDMGIIYRGGSGDKPLERGHVIRRNYFHDFGQTFAGQHAVYPDNLTMGWTIEENLFARIGNAQIPPPGNYAILLNSTAHINVRRNLFIDCMQPLVLSDYSSRKHYPAARLAWKRDITPERLAKLPHKQRYPELSQFWQENRQAPETNYYEQNLIWNPNLPLVDLSKPPISIFADGALDKLGTLRRSGNFVAKGDPGFINSTTGDFHLKPGAELLRRIPGFPDFDIREVGPRTARGQSCR